jgi:hypothetical protein
MNRKIQLFASLLLICFSFGTLSAQDSESDQKKSKKELKKEQQQAYYQAYVRLITSNQFEFDALSYITQKGGSNDLSTTVNYVKIKDSLVDLYLPFFGSSQTMNSFNQQNNAFIFKGELKNYKRSLDSKTGRVKVSFTAETKQETLDFTLNLYKNLSTRLVVNSSRRDGMIYDGFVVPLKEDKKDE